MEAWFNYSATARILLFSLLAGAALPGLFALGVRLKAAGTGALGAGTVPRPLLLIVAYVIYGLVVAAVILGVLYIARDFIAHHIHYPFLGGTP
ncbi:hypothetical protein [Mycobacterium sp.]|uniref:hypothetical protein n=1 Tax=Mycobacterium sp. TaxID=1785 RepID=UPI003A895AE7